MKEMDMTTIAAFFDLDRTLIDVNSALLYAKYERKHGRITTKMLIDTAFSSFLYHLNLLDMESAYEKATLHYRNRLEKEVAEQSKEFFRDYIEHRIQKGAIEMLEKHHKKGHKSVLLSSTSSFQGAIVCKTWGIEYSLTNEFPVKNGRLTGAFKRPFCYHQGKVEKAEIWAKNHQVNLDDSYFYSDSFSDLPMLKRVKNPRVVNPDPKLKKYAKKEGWPILNWKDD